MLHRPAPLFGLCLLLAVLAYGFLVVSGIA